MISFEKTANNVRCGMGKLVQDCRDLKNYSQMKPGEFCKRMTSLVLRVLASLIIAIGASIFAMGTIAIISRPNFTLITKTLQVIKLVLSSTASPFIFVAKSISGLAETILAKGSSIAALGFVTYIPTSYAYHLVMKINDKR